MSVWFIKPVPSTAPFMNWNMFAGFTSKLPADLLGYTTSVASVELSTVVQFDVPLVVFVVQLLFVCVSEGFDISSMGPSRSELSTGGGTTRILRRRSP